MYLTKYSFFVPTKKGGKYALYNSFNNIFAIIDEELKDMLESQDFSSLPQEYIDSLKQVEVIRDDDEDELKMLEYKKKSLRFASDKTEFYIIPTFACNIQCPPCKTRDVTMDEETVKSVIEAVKRETKMRGSSQLWTVLFGGEPLVELDTTFRISKEISEWAKREGIIFNNSLVSNGTLLSEEVIDKFKPYITSMQVQLEGSRDYHDRIRVYTNGEGTFDDVIESLMLLKENTVHTIINVPVTRENHKYIPELVDYLKGKGVAEGGIMHIRLFPSEKDSVCLSYSPLCGEGDTDAALLMDVWEQVWARGFRATAKPTQTPYCSCIKDGAYTIDPEGNVYKCIQMVGDPAKKAAVIKDGAISSKTDVFYDLMSRDATAITECSQCIYAPLCAGGCPLKAWNQNTTYHAPECGVRKTLFDKRIELFLRFKHPERFGEDEGTRTPNV